jgi:transposase
MSVSAQPPRTPEAIRIADLEWQLHWAQEKIKALEAQLHKRRVELYGPHSEKLSHLQLELLELEPGVSRAEVAAEAAREPVAPKPRRPHPGRQSLPENLPRVERTIECAPEACRCGVCGEPAAVIGYDVSEQLDVEPARYFVRVTKREKRACRTCGEGTVISAPLPARIVEKGLVSDRIVVETVIAKYCDHLPLYRQSAALERETGLEIGRATMDGWVMRVGELLGPVAAAMRKNLLDRPYLQADETTVPVQTHDKRGANRQAYLWQYGRPGGETVFEFCLGRGREGPKRFLGDYEGILQTDGYAAYDKIGGPKLTHAGCWAHARRKFVDAVKLNPKDAAAAEMVARMDALFAVDAEARRLGLAIDARHALRRERAAPLLPEIQAACKAALSRGLPAGALAGAANYTLAQWTRLRRFLDHAEIELSNNLAENSMRPVALGRKNWIHVGSVAAGPKVAAILSVVESCRRLGAPAKDYLIDILPGLADKSIRQMAELTPAAWSAKRS